ncbi:coordinator of PRMT5 and differentiation stimulator [Latimeria chalumnae]|uniref:coordinator of PRMT5 and differentiation stimulator n=1 Tax=Latimeria chalumnae TaxID=7897 RepID=UPI0003C130AE|nr:PREDICTED: coordinator of PRMT5 and differentiation stimulator [Latimeria chalumnae]|eukprot:XP_005993820.1 PREDICTED: coordinator of PRMT5 and differentiation stimulator [Latimeria chalumnae]
MEGEERGPLLAYAACVRSSDLSDAAFSNAFREDEKKSCNGPHCHNNNRLIWRPKLEHKGTNPPSSPNSQSPVVDQEVATGTNNLSDNDWAEDDDVYCHDDWDDLDDWDLDCRTCSPPNSVQLPEIRSNFPLEKEDWDKELEDEDPYGVEDVVEISLGTNCRQAPHFFPENMSYYPGWHHAASVTRVCAKITPEPGQFDDADD